MNTQNVEHKDFCLQSFNPPGPCICLKKRVPYFVTMRDEETQEELTFSMRKIEWEDGSDFWWSEGNYGCDCNRHLEFQEAKTGSRPMDDKVSCNGERYRVICIKLEDGTQVYGPELRDSSGKGSVKS